MKTVVITGSARGFGFAMAKLFYQNNYNVVLCDINETELDKALTIISEIPSDSSILTFNVDITKEEDIKVLIDETIKEFKNIDIWINNAGVNQPNKVLWELDGKTIDRLIDIDVKGVIKATSQIVKVMEVQGFGEIYNVEGHGSNDALITGLSLYGTAKRALTYYTDALIHEIKEKNLNIKVGKITPGIMYTNFISTSLGDGEKVNLDKQTKKIYNILGDTPETIAEFMVKRIINNKKQFPKFVWLTKIRATKKFMTYSLKKDNYFTEV